MLRIKAIFFFKMAGLKLKYVMNFTSFWVNRGMLSSTQGKPILTIIEPPTKISPSIARCFCKKPSGSPQQTFGDDEEKISKKKKSEFPKVLVQDLNGNITSYYLEEAEKLARKRNLSLEFLSKEGKKSIYLLKAKKEPPNILKAEKLKKFFIVSGLCDHDLQIKLNQMDKLIDKGKKILIDFRSKKNLPEELDAMYYNVEKRFADKCKITKVKGNMKLKIILTPEIKDIENKEETNENIKEVKKSS